MGGRYGDGDMPDRYADARWLVNHGRKVSESAVSPSGDKGCQIDVTRAIIFVY